MLVKRLEMRVFTVEFTFFSGVNWSNTDIKITALTIEDLEKEVKNQLQWMHENTTVEEKWNKIKSNITETILSFPIVEERVW